MSDTLDIAEFVDVLRLERLKRRIKSIDMAGSVGVALGTLSGWERHRSTPDPGHLQVWAAELGIPVPALAPWRRVAECGTLAGHAAHRRRGETPCLPCRAAAAKYMQKWRAAR